MRRGDFFHPDALIKVPKTEFIAYTIYYAA